MSKILGSWSGMRKYLEQEMLAESLRGRIRYGCTSYAGMDGCHIFEICIDGKQVKRFSWEIVNSFFIDNGYHYVYLTDDNIDVINKINDIDENFLLSNNYEEYLIDALEQLQYSHNNIKIRRLKR